MPKSVQGIEYMEVNLSEELFEELFERSLNTLWRRVLKSSKRNGDLRRASRQGRIILGVRYRVRVLNITVSKYQLYTNQCQKDRKSIIALEQPFNPSLEEVRTSQPRWRETSDKSIRLERFCIYLYPEGVVKHHHQLS